MSFFTDFLIANEADAPEIVASENPTEQWPGFSAKSITELDLANLWSILAAGSDLVALHRQFDHIFFDPDGECTVSKMPHPLVELLAGLGDSVLPIVAARWGDAEEFHDMHTGSALESLLRSLRDLAKRALTEGKAILVSISGT